MMTNHDDRLTLLTEGGDAAPVGEAGLRAGDLVGGYRIESVAGRGGMGIVYRATDPELGRLVALKLISPERATDQRFRELFVRESLNASALEHPNVIPIYRAGEDEGRLYIAMRFVDGVSLHDLIVEHGALPAGRAARILSRVADALDAAHARGLVHRDVKPANILIADPDGDEHVYLTDFGLSTRAARDATGGPAGWAGTLAYLAPEQVRGEPLDARTDVYALGCVLFHCLTGRVPFPGGEEVVPFAHLNEPVPRVTELAPDVPPALDDVVARAMAKRPEERYASAGELARAALAARFDIALCHSPAQAATANEIAGLLRDRGLQPVSASGDGAVEAVRSSGACAVLLGPDGLGAWARDALAAATDLAERDRAFRMAAVLCPGGPEPLDPGLAFFATRPWADLRDGVEGGVEDLVRALRATSPPVLGTTVSETCPYRGLEAFGEEHADDFFGREDDVVRVLERLRTGRFLAIVGASGSGKSSLIRAGVVPAIRRGALPGGENWRVIHLTPSARPLEALSAQLASLPGAGAPVPADLAAGPRAADLAMARALEGRPPEERVLLVVDQLEEAFTLCTDAGEREAFFADLVYAAAIPGGRAVVMAAIRADFYHRLADHPDLRTLVAARQHALGPLDAAGLRRAIEKPAARAGLELEPGLTRRILTDVSGRPGTLPLMEHLLYELWQRRRGSMLTLEAYGASGGVEGSLARRANAIFQGLSPERQIIARRVLLRLTQPGEGTEDTRRRAELRELATSPEERPEVEAVVGALAEARLVTAGRHEVTGEPVVDVTHEALIRGWPELRGWIDEDREALRLHRRLTDAASEWEAAGRDESVVYRGTRLGLWDERDLSSLNELEREFLAASRERAQRDRAARRRRVRVALGGLGAAVAIVSGLAVFGFVQRGEATDQRDLALSRQLAASSTLVRQRDPELAVLLAERAYGEKPTVQAEEALRQAVHESRIRGALRIAGELPIALDDAGRGRVAVASESGTLRIWDPRGDPEGATPEVVGRWRGGINALVDTPAGYVSGDPEGALVLWPRAGRPRRIAEVPGPINGIAALPGGRQVLAAGDAGLRVVDLDRGTSRLVARGAFYDALFDEASGSYLTASVDGRLQRWPQGSEVPETLVIPGAAQNLSLSPDGRLLAVGASDGFHVFRLAPEASLLFSRAVDGGVNGISFTPSGERLAVAGGDGGVLVYSVDGRRVARMNGHEGSVAGTTFLGADLVVSGGVDGTVRSWAWSAGLGRDLTGYTPASGGGITFRADGGVTIIGDDASSAVWDPRRGDVRRVLPALAPALAGAASPDGSLVVAGLADGRVVVRSPSGAGLATWRVGKAPIGVTYDPRGRRVAVALDGGDVRVAAIGDPQATTVGKHGSAAFAVAVNPTDGSLASGGRDGAVKIWGGPRGSRVLGRHAGQVIGVAFSSDGRWLASAGADRSVRVWDLSGGSGPRILRGHSDLVTSVAFTADGRLVSGGFDGLRIWDWRRGVTLLALTFAKGASQVAVRGNAPEIVHYGLDGVVRLSVCDVCGPIREVLALAGERTTRELTATERADFQLGG
jgi:WD40 repeat protein